MGPKMRDILQIMRNLKVRIKSQGLSPKAFELSFSFSVKSTFWTQFLKTVWSKYKK